MMLDMRSQMSFADISLAALQIWGAPFPNVTVAEDEEQLTAYCTTDKYGTRVLPEGAIQGVQFTKTPGYVQAVGYVDQTKIGLQANDYGGEEDPHGADQRGNPLGALVYSTAFGTENSNPTNFTQVIEWSYFVGGGIFCFKVSREMLLCRDNLVLTCEIVLGV